MQVSDVEELRPVDRRVGEPTDRVSDLPPWSRPSAHPLLGEDEIHVWRATLSSPAARVEWLFKILSPDERLRAERFHFQKDQRQFIIARGNLRMILGLYLGQDPDRVRFGYGAHGKPTLLGDGERGLRFNLSHAGGLALYAVARGRDVGLDIELVREEFAGPDIAAQFFSTREIRSIQSLPAGARSEAFFNCWTRKEAYIKATGEGLTRPLDQFDVSLTPGEPARLLSTRPDAREAEHWSMYELQPGPGYVAALAAEGRGQHLKFWQWAD